MSIILKMDDLYFELRILVTDSNVSNYFKNWKAICRSLFYCIMFLRTFLALRVDLLLAGIVE